MKVTRRDLFVWGAGAAAGLVFTPVPWKVLDDLSIWTQNWPWIPQPARGPVEVKQSFCALCPQGCALKIRMAAGFPAGVAGVSENPLTHGALCPLAYGAHQLNWHPQRVRTVQHKGITSGWSEARTAFVKAIGEGPVVVIDGHAGRAGSLALEKFAEKHNGSYRVARTAESRALLPYESWSGVPASSLGYDLENLRTIVSFGAPLLDGWGMPGRFTRLWATRGADAKDPELRLIQIEDVPSRTANLAWQWIDVRSGSEDALAGALARVLIEERRVAARGPVPTISIAEAVVQTGLSEAAIRELARTMVERPPVLALAAEYNPSVAALNVVLGGVGSRGGVVARRERGEKFEPADAPIRNARAVLIDASVPWNFSPQTDAEIFRFAAWDGGSPKADWLLPAPGFQEELNDVPAPPTLAVETYAIAPQICSSGFEVFSASQFLRAIDSTLPAIEEAIRGRCEGIFRGRTGTIYGREGTRVAKFDSAEKLQAELQKGAMWVGDSASVRLRCELKEWPESTAAESSQGWATSWTAPVLPPLATKLYRESSLREPPDRRTA